MDVLREERWVVKVLGRNKLDAFGRKHADAKKVLDAWFHETNDPDCIWKTTQDIKNRYRSADFLDGNRIILNIKGNHYRLVIQVRYQSCIVAVEWIGTHAEYDKKTF